MEFKGKQGNCRLQLENERIMPTYTGFVPVFVQVSSSTVHYIRYELCIIGCCVVLCCVVRGAFYSTFSWTPACLFLGFDASNFAYKIAEFFNVFIESMSRTFIFQNLLYKSQYKSFS